MYVPRGRWIVPLKKPHPSTHAHARTAVPTYTEPIIAPKEKPIAHSYNILHNKSSPPISNLPQILLRILHEYRGLLAVDFDAV